MRVIATAGHVDHGKSTLVEALTGMRPDRWAEEQRRGLTIGLGFAWTTDTRLAFVDVPGHERFVPTMLAGIGPVPAVLFVVAADGGWMPQSTEHLAALDALGVRHGLLAVTRADLADPEPARRAALDRLAGTSLAGIDSVAVSPPTGQGIAELRAALDRLAGSLPAADPAADVRLWIDRAFSITGAGTVVTGTLAAGTLRVGDELLLASTGARVRVRGLHSLGRPADPVPAIARVAVNLRGVPRDAVEHGDALLTPEAWLPTEEIDVLPHGGWPGELPRELMLHIGSAAVAVRVRQLGGDAVRLRLARPLPLRVGDRALLRDPGRHQVSGGVDVLDVRPPELRRRGAARSRATELVRLRAAPRAELAESVLRHVRFATPADFRAMGLPVAGAAVTPDWYAHPEVCRALAGELAELVRGWAADHPLRPGVPVRAAAQRLGLPAPELVDALAARAGLAIVDGRVDVPDRAPELPGPIEAAIAELTGALAAEPFVAADANRLAELRLGNRELAAAVRAGRLLKLTDGVFLLPGAEKQAGRVLAELPQPFTLSQARQALHTTRRVAVPLLELLDRKGMTERFPDDTRRIAQPPTD